MAKDGFATREKAEQAAERHNEYAEQFNAPAQKMGLKDRIRYKEVYHYRDPVSNDRKWFLRDVKD